MAEGLPQQTLLGQRYRTPLSAKVFSSWDFCIRVWEAATIKKHEISNELKMELEEGRRVELAQQQTRAQKACRLLTYLRTNILIVLLVVGAISAIFWATKYSQDNKEVQETCNPFFTICLLFWCERWEEVSAPAWQMRKWRLRSRPCLGELHLRNPDLPSYSPQESLFLVLQYLPPGVISLVNFLGPQLFTVLIQLENYPPGTEVNLTLIW